MNETIMKFEISLKDKGNNQINWIIIYNYHFFSFLKIIVNVI